MGDRTIGWKDQLEMMEYLASCCDFPDYEAVRQAMSNAFAEKYHMKAADLFTYEPIPDRELRQFLDWLASYD